MLTFKQGDTYLTLRLIWEHSTGLIDPLAPISQVLGLYGTSCITLCGTEMEPGALYAR